MSAAPRMPAAAAAPRFTRRGLLKASAATALGAAVYPLFDRFTRPAPRHNVLFILIDTLRADHLGCYGYPRETSPNIDSLAARGTLYLANKAHSSMTTASMAQIFCGALTPAHFVPTRGTTFAEILRHYGWRTLAVQTNPWLDKARGFTRGFDRYEMLLPALPSEGVDILGDWWNRPKTNAFYIDAAGAFEKTREVLAAAAQGPPWLLYLHLMDVHGPYIPRDEFDLFSNARRSLSEKAALSGEFVASGYRRRFDRLRELAGDAVALYDGEIREADDCVGRLVALLEERGLFDDTMVIVTADHGEEFGEHDIVQHSNGVWETQIATPLVVKYPGQKTPAKVARLSRGIDLAPTVLEALGFTPRRLAAWHIGGRPLQRTQEAPAAFTQALLVKERDSVTYGYFSAENAEEGLKLILETEGREIVRTGLFNLWNDPGEKSDLAAALPEKTRELGGKLVGLGVLDRSYDLEKSLDDEQRRRLRALGYLN